MKNVRRRREALLSISLRSKSKILGVSPTYLSLLLNGKRPWRGNLKERDLELVNTPEADSQQHGSSLMNREARLPVYDAIESGAEERTRTLRWGYVGKL